MNRRSQLVFLALVVVQAAHSIEEYTFALYDVFLPARLVSSAVGSVVDSDLATGFAIVNTLLVVFGLWCYAFPVRSGGELGRALAWVWVAIELGNGVVHPALALRAGGYFPGVATAPLLLVLAIGLAALLRDRTHRGSS